MWIVFNCQVGMAHIQKCHPGKPATPVSTAMEKRAYLERNMLKIQTHGQRAPAFTVQRPAPSHSIMSPPVIALNADGTPRAAFYRCKLCGYQEARHDKTKYHVIKQHLKLGLFSCPHCHKYLWGRHYVARHIRECHPGKASLLLCYLAHAHAF